MPEKELKFDFKNYHPVILYCPNPECSHPWNVKIKEDGSQVVCTNCHTSGPKLDTITDTIDVWNQFKRNSRDEYETEEVELELTQEDICWLSTKAHNLKVSFNTYINAVLVNALNHLSKTEEDKNCSK